MEDGAEAGVRHGIEKTLLRRCKFYFLNAELVRESPLPTAPPSPHSLLPRPV